MYIGDIFQLSESISDWQGNFVHYSKVPYLKMNSNPFHQDPIALYFFPESFKPNAMWPAYKYKFTVNLKSSAKVLDFSTLEFKDVEEIAKKANIFDKYKAHIEQYPPSTPAKAINQLWDDLVAYYSWENGDGKKLASFNKLFRDMGYDAIFDDTGAVHSSEVQLIVFNPRAITVLKLDQNKGSGFKELMRVMADVETVCRQYGHVEVEQPRKQKDSWSKEKLLRGAIKVTSDDKKEAYINFTVENNQGSLEVHAGISYSRPNLGYGSGVRYNINTQQYEKGYFERFSADIERIFTSTPNQL